jgi:hypothetical protein
MEIKKSRFSEEQIMAMLREHAAGAQEGVTFQPVHEDGSRSERMSPAANRHRRQSRGLTFEMRVGHNWARRTYGCPSSTEVSGPWQTTSML